jgi:2,4-dichlorophenol 6-monooxygenase
MAELEVPVLIVGGGGCGLSASLFLSNLGVEHLLVERHSSTSQLPKAHYLNQRARTTTSRSVPMVPWTTRPRP